MRYMHGRIMGGGGGEVGFASRTRVFFDGDQIVPGFQIVKVTWNNISWDDNGEWDAANNGFVCKEDGLYQLNAAVQFPNYYAGAHLLFIRNGTDTLMNVNDRPGGGGTWMRAVRNAKLVAGDYVDVRILHMKSPTITLFGGSSCMWFDVCRIA